MLLKILACCFCWYFCAFACPSAGYPWGTWLSLYYVLCALCSLSSKHHHPLTHTEDWGGWGRCSVGSCALCLLSVHININNLYNATLCWIRCLYLFLFCTFFAFSFNTLYTKKSASGNGNGKRETRSGEMGSRMSSKLLTPRCSIFRIFLNFVTFSFLFFSFDAPCGYRTRDDKFVFAPRFSRIVFCKLLFTVLRMLRDMPQWPGKQTDRQRETSDRLWLSDYNENESCDCVGFLKRKLFTES